MRKLVRAVGVAAIVCGACSFDDDGNASSGTSSGDDDGSVSASASATTPTDTGTATADATDDGNTDGPNDTTAGPVTGTDDGQDQSTGAEACVQATLLWSDDFETGDYSRWTSMTYDANWNGGACHDNGFSEEAFVSAGHSHRSEITCTSDMRVHRGYGGLQFEGDAVLENYTNQGEGLEAPFGVVNTFWSRLDVPYAFENGRWFSFWTVNDACDYSSSVLTLGLENAQNVLTPAHVLSTGGTVEFAENAPSFPIGEFARITIYVNYYDGVLHVWQDGESVVHATFARPATDLCQWHWGAYASGDNDDIVLWEDDNSLWRLEEEWTDFGVEPWLGETFPPC